MSDRYSSLKPPALIASIRSMPRRWAAALSVPPPKSIEDFFTVTGPSGTTAAAEAGAALTMIDILENAIRTTSYPEAEALDPAVESAVANEGSGPWPDSASAALERIEDLMNRLGDRLEALNPADWNRTASTPTSEISITQLAQGAVRVAAERLARTERVIDAVS